MIKPAVEITYVVVTMLASSGSSAVGLADVMSQRSPVFNESTLMPFGLFLGGVAMTATVAWKICVHKTKTDHFISDLTNRIKKLEDEKSRQNR